MHCTPSQHSLWIVHDVAPGFEFGSRRALSSENWKDVGAVSFHGWRSIKEPVLLKEGKFGITVVHAELEICCSRLRQMDLQMDAHNQDKLEGDHKGGLVYVGAIWGLYKCDGLDMPDCLKDREGETVGMEVAVYLQDHTPPMLVPIVATLCKESEEKHWQEVLDFFFCQPMTEDVFPELLNDPVPFEQFKTMSSVKETTETWHVANPEILRTVPFPLPGRILYKSAWWTSRADYPLEDKSITISWTPLPPLSYIKIALLRFEWFMLSLTPSLGGIQQLCDDTVLDDFGGDGGPFLDLGNDYDCACLYPLCLTMTWPDNTSWD
ncbi:hypothetical protein FOMPIDRAFT_1020853 [Fomitopsis schrenkii]|uniref:Uncharacterized protein n=1 Tax=Fomitopsis schrenkii TaxID=2126942 RepID=S8DNG6_FOMSC|nr:hypothetical protein FOMPIDRAFT_1020853 [Fomitopsis schrenkii]